ncbi:ABC-type multidrug transporter, ATPase component [Arthrobacter crystallopoietes BAB-32]|uniref:ABC-type multidrug transporter, ATPase component n=1 Tax=Arthrobacter crystallopoietes BAB-32 TaxID=1246476 RepID=N1UX15_9MICC|nr:ABC transporter ATP-binding protein [Arthrobacter crystallopoietes]EMY34941.1 ABC-type multidrug transporter, ATPase component [Arthrobacter crystallopoietes BAB-32]
MGRPAVVEASGLVKLFGRTRALDGLDLSVGEGEVHGFLGPNGAGKSTTLRVLLGLIRPTSGAVRVLGRDPWAEPVAVHRDIAYVPGDVNLWPNLTGGEVVDLLTGLRGGADAGLRERLVEEFGLDPRRKVRSYSKGNRQKVALVAAFARPARLYLLDEPSSGLDPVMDAVFRRQIRRVADEGATVLLSSHILSEVEQLCGRVTIIRAGRAVETGSLAQLRHLRRTRFRITLPPGGQLPALPAAVHDVAVEDNTVEFDVESADLPAVLAGLAELRLTAVEAAPPSLESLFLRHYDAGARP